MGDVSDYAETAWDFVLFIFGEDGGYDIVCSALACP